MAGGDLALTLDGRERADEIGTMVSAVEVFRVAAQAQVTNVEKQEVVVCELAAALHELGEGNVAYRSATICPTNIVGWPARSTTAWKGWHGRFSASPTRRAR